MDTQTRTIYHPLKSEPVHVTYRAEIAEEAGRADDAQKAYAAQFGGRVRTLRGDLTRAQLAEKIGVHVNTIGKFERGDSMPDAYLIILLCANGGRSAEWLLSGAHRFDDTPAKAATAVEAGIYLYVPHFDIQASAGNGAFGDLERVTAMRPFDAGFIRQELGVSHNDLAICNVAGRSAEPRFYSKDVVMIDRRDVDVRTEGMHVVRMDGALFVKTLQRLPGKVLRVSSNNPDFTPFEINGADGGDTADLDFCVIGRVRWGGVVVQ